MAGKCRRCIITQAFGEPHDNALADEGQCCDVCDLQPHQLRDCKEELDIATDAIHTLGPRGEVKLSEWIRGNKRPWMEMFKKSTKSFSNSKGHSEKWWRNFFRKCHVMGLKEDSNMVKANQHMADEGDNIIMLCEHGLWPYQIHELDGNI